MFFKMKYLIYFLIIFVTSISDIQTFGVGKCPKKSSMQDFNITRFTGQWFEVERSFYMMEMIASCTSLNFTLEANGNLNVLASTVNRWTEKTSIKTGTAIPLVKGSSVLRFRPNSRLPQPIARMLPGAGIYYVVYTNYDNFAIIWSCTNYAVVYVDRFWILGRERDFNAADRINVYNATQTHNLDPDRLINSKNYFCD